MAKRDFYEILGVSKGASEDEIKKAYRQKALQFHPDRNPGDKASEDKFKEAAEAYEVLGDKAKRQRYDQFGHAGVGSSAASDGGMGGFGGGFGGGAQHMNMEDIFSRFGDIFGEGFGGGMGGGGGRRVNRGSDLRIKLKLTLQEIANGADKKIKVGKHMSCKECKGTGGAKGTGFKTCDNCHGSGYINRVQRTFIGQIQTTAPCPTCNGEGKIITDKCKACHGQGTVLGEDVVSVKIPAGVEDGMQLSVSGQGNAAPRGGVPGDLIILIEEIEDEHLKRNGLNLYYDHYLSMVDAALGTTIEVPTLDGKAKVKIEPGTQGNTILRLRGKGLPRVNHYGKGDILVNVNVWTPQNLNSEEKKILDNLRKSQSFTPKPGKKDKSFIERIKEIFE
ncbi:MAG TPA: molecular chaperone DnaJ [Bacteroidia bacterium]|jgi:molecular chaperone DnaJ|nr:molecular chaperone DnaJ [Bacteroidia bacterium]